MTQVIEKNSIIINKEPMVMLPLEKWQKIEQLLDEHEDYLRYREAIDDPDNQGAVSFDEVKKELNLP